MESVDKVWTVADVMVEDVVTVTADAPYKRLVELLWTYGISGLPVVDAAGNTVGIVSESDLLPHDEGGGSAIVAGDLMTAPVTTIGPDATLTEAARVMRERNLKRLPVLDDSGHLVGIISRADLLKVFLRSQETLSWDVDEVLRRSLVVPGTVRSACSEGVVTVAGQVETEAQARHIETALGKLPGVVAVKSELSWPAQVG